MDDLIKGMNWRKFIGFLIQRVGGRLPAIRFKDIDKFDRFLVDYDQLFTRPLDPGSWSFESICIDFWICVPKRVDKFAAMVSAAQAVSLRLIVREDDLDRFPVVLEALRSPRSLDINLRMDADIYQRAFESLRAHLGANVRRFGFYYIGMTPSLAGLHDFEFFASQLPSTRAYLFRERVDKGNWFPCVFGAV